MRGWLAISLSIVAALFATSIALAQIKPVARVAVNSLDSLMADFKYLATATDNAPGWNAAQVLLKGFTEGIDRTKPLGLVILAEGEKIKGYGFVPVKNLNAIVETIETNLGIEIAAAGNGISKAESPLGTFYFKEIQGWAYIAMKVEDLQGVAADPSKYVAPLLAKYDVAGEVYVKNIPRVYLDPFEAAMKNVGQPKGLESLEGVDDAQA